MILENNIYHCIEVLKNSLSVFFIFKNTHNLLLAETTSLGLYFFIVRGASDWKEYLQAVKIII